MALVFPPVRTLIGFPYVPVGVTLKAGATYSEAHYPLSNLSDGYGRFMWRNTYETAAIQLDLGYDRPVNFVGLIGHNLSHNLLVSVFASRDNTSLGLPLYPLDDELEVTWAQMQIFARAVGVRYPNLWCDCRDAQGDPTVAQYWQVHVTDNGAPVALGEVVVGFADEYEGIIRSPYREQLYSWQTRHKLVHGPEVISGSNVVSRTMELDLSMTPEDRAILDDVYAFAAAGPLDGQRVVVVPDSRRNDLWFVEWPARREATFPGASYRVAEQTITLVEETFGATPSAPPTSYVQPTPPSPSVGITAGTIMVGGYGDAGFAFLSPDGATLYPQPASAPVAGDGLIAMCRTSDGHIGQMGGTAGDFALSWTGLFNASDLTVIGEYNDSAHTYVNGELIAADASGHWYTGKVSGGNFHVARITAALAREATWTIAQPAGYTSASMKALAVSGDGLTAYVWMALASGGDANHYRVHKYSLSGSGSYVGPLSTDWSTGPGYQSLVCVPGTSDVLVCFESINTTSVSTSAVRRYTSSGTLVWTAGTPTGSVNWEWESVAIGGATDFVALAYTDDTTFSGCRYVWFDYATGTPDNTRNFAPDDGAGFVFNSQFAVLASSVT